MAEAILLTLRETWSGYVEGLRLVIPRLLAMLSVVVAGWLIAALARAVVGRVLGWLRVARLAERTGDGGAPAQGRAAAGGAPRRLRGLLDPLPRLPPRRPRRARASRPSRRCGPRSACSCRGWSAALAILAVGLVLANVVWRVVLLAAVNAGWPSARLVGGAVYFLTVTIAAAMALDHVGLARPIVLTAFAIVVGAVMLALAIAVGVGSGPLVRRLLEERLVERSRPESDGSSHL